MEDRTLQDLEEIFDEIALLRQINWTPRVMAVLIRSKMLSGHFDPTTKMWMTSRSAIRRALEARKNELITEGLESIEEED